MKKHSFKSMNVVEVFPISRGIPTRSLSYFTGSALSKGDVTTVPLRNKEVPAVVFNAKSASEAKTHLKSADYSLRKLDQPHARNLFRLTFLEAVEEIADFFVASPGAVLYDLIPSPILESAESVKEISSPSEKTNLQAPEPHVLQGTPAEREKEYKRIIRSSIARESSVFFVLPTVEDVKEVTDVLQKGIDEYVSCLHGSLSSKQTISRWNEIVSESHPVVVVMTPQFLSVPRFDVETIILDKEGSASYTQQFRPSLDFRTVAEIISQKYKAQLIMGDTLLRTETIWRYREEEVQHAYPPRFRYEKEIEQYLIDMKQHSDEKNDSFEIFSDPLKQKLDDSLDESILLLVSRKGLHPFTICGDCGELVECEQCSYPLTLKETAEGRSFTCKVCRNQYDPDRVCATCESWRLWPLGIGTQRVVEELEDTFPERSVFHIDKDTTSTPKKIRDTITSFKKESGGVIVATQMVIPFLPQIDSIGIVSMDALLSIPDLSINEDIFRLITNLRIKAKKSLFLQTRSANTEILSKALEGNVSEFYRSEIRDRKKFQYPPFSLLIKITVKASASSVKTKVNEVMKLIKDYDVETYPAFTHQQKGKRVMHILLKVPHETWPEEKLLSKLHGLNPAYKIAVQPHKLI